MASEVQICNLALAKIGDQQITSLTENSKAGRLCNLVYEPLRDATLRAHPWNFAITRETLALHSLMNTLLNLHCQLISCVCWELTWLIQQNLY